MLLISGLVVYLGAGGKQKCAGQRGTPGPGPELGTWGRGGEKDHGYRM